MGGELIECLLRSHFCIEYHPSISYNRTYLEGRGHSRGFIAVLSA